MSLFTAKRADGRAEWRVIYDRVITLAYGDDLTFGTIAELLESDDRQQAYRAVRECNKHLREDKDVPVRRYLGAVRGVGYRVLMPGEYTHAALAKKKTAVDAIHGAANLMRVAPYEDMSPAARQWAHQVNMHLAEHEFRLMTMEERQQYAEERIAQLERAAGFRHPSTIPGEAEAS